MLQLRKILYLVFLVAGCDAPISVSVIPNPQPFSEIPVVNIPQKLRQQNWPSTAGEGSCVIASSISHLHWQDQSDVATKLRSRYSGGQTATSIRNIWKNERIPFVYTESGDPSFMEWASASGRGAICWFLPSHCQTFVGFSKEDGVEYAYLLDNNRINQFTKLTKREFLRAWRGYGGFAMTALFSPSPPLPWPAYLPSSGT
jgi:hypothetical protein